MNQVFKNININLKVLALICFVGAGSQVAKADSLRPLEVAVLNCLQEKGLDTDIPLSDLRSNAWREYISCVETSINRIDTRRPKEARDADKDLPKE